MISTHKHHIISTQHISHKCLPEKSCLHCLRILIISWLFKDPINSGLAQFEHAQSNSKKRSKSLKDQIASNIFFLEKQLMKFSCAYWPLSFCNFFKKIFRANPKLLRMYHFRAQNGPFVMNKFFLVQTIIITFIYLLALFIVQNLKKFLQRIQSYEDVPFLGPKWSICPKQFFLENY